MIFQCVTRTVVIPTLVFISTPSVIPSAFVVLPLGCLSITAGTASSSPQPSLSNCIMLSSLLLAWANDNTSEVPQARIGRCRFYKTACHHSSVLSGKAGGGRLLTDHQYIINVLLMHVCQNAPELLTKPFWFVFTELLIENISLISEMRCDLWVSPLLEYLRFTLRKCTVFSDCICGQQIS